MPMIAPLMKVNNCKKYGAIVLMYGNDLGEVSSLSCQYTCICLSIDGIK
jgi:hypothetical protein